MRCRAALSATASAVIAVAALAACGTPPPLTELEVQILEPTDLDSLDAQSDIDPGTDGVQINVTAQLAGVADGGPPQIKQAKLDVQYGSQVSAWVPGPSPRLAQGQRIQFPGLTLKAGANRVRVILVEQATETSVFSTSRVNLEP